VIDDLNNYVSKKELPETACLTVKARYAGLMNGTDLQKGLLNS
jgi:iron-sulfur cluster repair protein YtfE (RIC family)